MAKIYYLFAAMLLGASSVAAEDVEFTYAPAEEGTLYAIGAGRKNIWNDLAIRLDNPGYAGYQITGVSIDVPIVEGCECDPNAKVWLAKNLEVDQTTYDCITDISYDAVITNYGTEAEPAYRVDLTFPQPYTLTSDGIYVGYSLKVTALKNSTQKYPLQVMKSSNPDGGMYVHYGYNYDPSLPALPKNKKFLNLGVENGQVSTMRVYLHGEKAENDAGLVAQRNIIAAIGEKVPVKIVLTNYGGNDINEITYIFTPGIGEAQVQTGSIALESPLASQESVDLDIPFEVPDVNGDYDCGLTITTVNGVENGNSSKSAQIMVYSRPWIPRKRVLVDEYTGFWCQSCPAAYVAIKQMEDKYPDSVEVVAYHSGDSVQSIPSSEFPASTPGLPYIIFDRAALPINMRLLSDKMVECADELAPADIDVDIYWTDDTKNEIRAEANLHFVDPAEADQYRLTYVLVEDDMSDPKWQQTNFYWNQDPSADEWYRTDYWDLFIGKSMFVNDIVYDCVAHVTTESLGIPESVPAVEADGRCSHHAMLSLAKAISIAHDASEGKNVIKDKNKLRVVASLVDKKSGKAVNTNSSVYAAEIPIYNPSVMGVENIEVAEAAELVEEEYYTLDGIRLPERPAKGATIIVSRYSDGSVKTAKVMQ